MIKSTTTSIIFFIYLNMEVPKHKIDDITKYIIDSALRLRNEGLLSDFEFLQTLLECYNGITSEGIKMSELIMIQYINGL